MPLPLVRIKDVQMVALSNLVPHPKNPNAHTPEQIERLAQIIEFQGWRYPIKVSRRSGFVTSGHGRMDAAQLRGWAQVPVSFQDYDTEAQEYADIVSDNAIAEWSVLDLARINTDIIELGPDFDIDLLGIKDFTLDPSEGEPGADEDDAPEPPKVAKTKLGDIYELGAHRLICGDATDSSTLVRLMAGTAADMMWTDPPYNVDYKGGTGPKIMNDSMSAQQFRKFLTDSFRSACAVLKPGGAFYIAHADSEGFNFRAAVNDSGMTTKQCLIWKKSSLVMGRQDYQWIHEPILYGWKPGAAHSWFSDIKQTTVLEFPKPSKNEMHPTMKPVELVEYCLNNSADLSQIVLDPFGGSGTTMIASQKNNMKCYMAELDPAYCDVIVSRWEKYTGQKAKLQNARPAAEKKKAPAKSKPKLKKKRKQAT